MTSNAEDDAAVGPPEHLSGLAGMDLVRRTLEEARGAARVQGKDVGRGRNSPVRRRVAGTSRRRWSGPGPDSRDPQLLGSLTQDVARNRGWSGRVGRGVVVGRGGRVVGGEAPGPALAGVPNRLFPSLAP